jgi:hypothetical protein
MPEARCDSVYKYTVTKMDEAIYRVCTDSIVEKFVDQKQLLTMSASTVMDNYKAAGVEDGDIISLELWNTSLNLYKIV